jgi:enoyl-CoA hydratase/carnithine racemase
VHDIFSADQLLERVREFAASLVALDPEAVALAKLVIDLSDPHDREKTRHVERMANTDLQHRGVGHPATDHRGPTL